MRLLAIDTSGRALSAALAEDGEIIASFGVDEGKNHSLTLLPHLQQLLEEQQLSLAQMDAFAVTIGPALPVCVLAWLPLRPGDKPWLSRWWQSPLWMPRPKPPLPMVMLLLYSMPAATRYIRRFTVTANA